MKRKSIFGDIIAQITGGCSDCDNDDWVEEDTLPERTEAPAKVDRCVKDVKKRLVSKFKEEHKKSPSKKQLKQLESSAWAICQKQMKVKSSKKEFTREDAYEYMRKVIEKKGKENG